MGSDKVWVLNFPCGQSRMVPRTTPADRRRQLIEQHQAEHGCGGADE